MYKLTNSTSILRITDNAYIPNDPLNTDYSEYLNWISEGNEAASADVPAEPTYAELRREAYPLKADYLDAVVKGDETQMQKYIDDCLAVKAKYPKPTA